MAEPTHNRDRAADRRWWSAGLAAAFLLIAGSGAVAHDAGGADQSSESPPRTVVDFEDLGVLSEQGRLVVDYEIAGQDWQQLEHIDLWLQLRAPTELKMHPDQSYAYTLPIETPSGRRAFPRWLTPESSENVRVCLLATGPTDNLLYGSGYSCTEPVWLPVQESRPETARRTHTFALQYFAGPPYIPYAPWVEPRVPGFQGPFDQLPAP